MICKSLDGFVAQIKEDYPQIKFFKSEVNGGNLTKTYKLVKLNPNIDYGFPLVFTFDGALHFLGAGYSKYEDSKKIRDQLDTLL